MRALSRQILVNILYPPPLSPSAWRNLWAFPLHLGYSRCVWIVLFSFPWLMGQYSTNKCRHIHTWSTQTPSGTWPELRWSPYGLTDLLPTIVTGICSYHAQQLRPPLASIDHLFTSFLFPFISRMLINRFHIVFSTASQIHRHPWCFPFAGSRDSLVWKISGWFRCHSCASASEGPFCSRLKQGCSWKESHIRGWCIVNNRGDRRLLQKIPESWSRGRSFAKSALDRRPVFGMMANSCFWRLKCKQSLLCRATSFHKFGEKVKLEFTLSRVTKKYFACTILPRKVVNIAVFKNL